MTSFTSRYGNPAQDFKGAHVRAHCRHGATVVTVSGRVDAGNVDQVTESALRAIPVGSRLVLDLSGVTTFTPRAAALISAVDDRCLAVGVEWALVPSKAVSVRLRTTYGSLPVIDSVAAAEHRFDDQVLRRRGVVLPLLRRTA